MTDTPGMLTYDLFAPLIGTGFAVQVDGYDDTLTLTDAALLKHQVPDAARPGFSLDFAGGRDDIMFEQQTLDMTHPALGTVSVMITPVDRAENGVILYHAVFN